MDKKKLLRAISAFSEHKILVLGDVILDAYYKGEVTRISPEAPVPVVSLRSKEFRLGGAANVALNVKDLGAKCVLCSIIGEDDSGKTLVDLMEKEGMSSKGLIASPHRRTTVKARVMSGSHQMLRLDEEDDRLLRQSDEDLLLNRVNDLIESEQPDAIIFEDYDKGALTPKLIQNVIETARSKGIPVSVDPKRRNFLAYRGATLFKPNLKELKEGLNWPDLKTDDKELKEAHAKLNERMPIDMSFFTLSAEGVFITDGKSHSRLPAFRRSIADVSGAGDTVIAVATCALSGGLSMEEIAYVSNLAAGWVCQFPGVVSIQRDALIEEVTKTP
jgi:rfaE bifunctional protein kinase chain/domain